MESIQNLLGGRVPTEPPEIQTIKAYFKRTYDIDVRITISDKDIAVLVPNAALANNLRMRAPEIQRECRLTKRLRFTLV